MNWAFLHVSGSPSTSGLMNDLHFIRVSSRTHTLLLYTVRPDPCLLQTVTFFVKNSVHSFSPQELETSFAMRPSQRTVGETWMPFCLEYLTICQLVRNTPKGSGWKEAYWCT